VLAAVLSPYRHEFRDNATERASTTRLLNLYRRSRLERTVFISLLAEAAARTRENVRLGAIEGPAFAYLVSVLEQLLHPDAPGEGNRPAAAPQNALQSIPPSDPLFQATSSSPPGHSPSEGLTAPPEETNPIWKAVLHELQLVLTEANFQTWLATTRVLRQSENTLQVGVPRQFHADWLNHKLRTRITRTMERLGYAGLQVEFVVAGAG
jgi:hypothetical protein